MLNKWKVTHFEIEKGVLGDELSKKVNVLAFLREIQNIEPVRKESDELTLKQSYIDLLANQEVDLEAKQRIGWLKEKLAKSLPPQNIFELNVL